MRTSVLLRTESEGGQSDAGASQHSYWPIIGYAAYTLTLFLVFLLTTFPWTALVQWTLQGVDPGPLLVDTAGADFAWHRGIEIHRVAVRHVDSTPEFPPLLYFPRLYVRPAIADLFRGRLESMRITGSLYGGALISRWQRRAGQLNGTIRLTDLRLERHPALAALLEEGQLRGMLDLAMTVSIPRSGIFDATGAGEIRAEDVALEAAKIRGFGLPDLHFASVLVRIEQNNRRLEIQTARAEGPELTASASGQVVLRDPLPSSVLNLRAVVEPGPESPDAIAGLIRMIPRRGSRPGAPLSITGTLANPRIR